MLGCRDKVKRLPGRHKEVRRSCSGLYNAERSPGAQADGKKKTQQ